MKQAVYLLDTHVHTSEVSGCGKVPAKHMVQYYKDAGYQGIIITDHYYEGYFEQFPGWSWEAKIRKFLSGYRAAFKQGNSIGLDVFLGIELRFHDSFEDYLVYGVTQEFLLNNPELYNHTLRSFKDFIQGKDILVFQAHPFRAGLKPADPKLLDGVEVLNGHPRHNSHNDLAYSFAEKNGLLMIAGSDAHRSQDVGMAEIRLPQPIKSIHELVEWFKKGKPIEIFCLHRVGIKN